MFLALPPRLAAAFSLASRVRVAAAPAAFFAPASAFGAALAARGATARPAAALGSGASAYSSLSRQPPSPSSPSSPSSPLPSPSSPLRWRSRPLLLQPRLAAAAVASAPLSGTAPSRSSTTIPRAVLRLVRGGGANRTKSAVKKRFRVNGGGLLIRKQSGKREWSGAGVDRAGCAACVLVLAPGR
jgi:hypothetical protein